MCSIAHIGPYRLKFRILAYHEIGGRQDTGFGRGGGITALLNQHVR